jgi:hypothetical protein
MRRTKMGEPARTLVETVTQDLNVRMNPKGRIQVVINKRNARWEGGSIRWTKNNEAGNFKFTNFRPIGHEQYGNPFVDIRKTDDEIVCSFDPGSAPLDTKFEYTIEAEYTGTFDSDEPGPEIVPMGPGDNKAVIRN